MTPQKLIKEQNKLLEDILKSPSFREFFENIKPSKDWRLTSGITPYNFTESRDAINALMVDKLDQLTKLTSEIKTLSTYMKDRYTAYSHIKKEQEKAHKPINLQILKFLEDYEREYGRPAEK